MIHESCCHLLPLLYRVSKNLNVVLGFDFHPIFPDQRPPFTARNNQCMLSTILEMMEPRRPLPDELIEHLLGKVALTGTWGECWI
jgi:hypothetical protein